MGTTASAGPRAHPDPAREPYTPVRPPAACPLGLSPAAAARIVGLVLMAVPAVSSPVK